MKRKIIIDCDPGIDDSLALMLALSSDDIEVLGITIVSGNTPVQMGFENAKKVLKHMQRLDIPIYIGAAVPLMKEYVNALDTHGKDGLGESFLPDVSGYQQDKDAVSFLIETLKKEHNVVAVDAMAEAKKLGNAKIFNTIIIGVAAKRMDFDKKQWLEVIENTVPPKTIELNKAAFEAGYALV